MGKGLCLKKSGAHVAFTAGTGILVFVDLVAFLIREQLSQLSKEEESAIDKDFKFILFASFPNEGEVIGNALCEGLTNLCEKSGNKNFEFRLRLSNKNKARWDKDFIMKEMKAYAPVKIWICGPPMLNENFDRVLGENLTELGIKREDYETM